jgi:hypothetical protein
MSTKRKLELPSREALVSTCETAAAACATSHLNDAIRGAIEQAHGYSCRSGSNTTTNLLLERIQQATRCMVCLDTPVFPVYFGCGGVADEVRHYGCFTCVERTQHAAMKRVKLANEEGGSVHTAARLVCPQRCAATTLTSSVASHAVRLGENMQYARPLGGREMQFLLLDPAFRERHACPHCARAHVDTRHVVECHARTTECAQCDARYASMHGYTAHLDACRMHACMLCARTGLTLVEAQVCARTDYEAYATGNDDADIEASIAAPLLAPLATAPPMRRRHHRARHRAPTAVAEEQNESMRVLRTLSRAQTVVLPSSSTSTTTTPIDMEDVENIPPSVAH